MRDYIFHGKRVDNGEWVEGNLTVWPDGSASIDNGPTMTSPLYAVIPESVGQYTGMKDKNGRKIFEGDIIQRVWDDHPTVYRVIFDELLAAFIGEVRPYGQFTTFDGDGEHFEVIGTVFENADLLESNNTK